MTVSFAAIEAKSIGWQPLGGGAYYSGPRI